MFGNTFYHGLIRKYIIMFGNMFNDIEIYRYASDGSIAKQIRVPIAYAPKEKFYVRLREDPQLNRQVSQVLPRLAFELVDMSYSPERSLNKLIKNNSVSDLDSSLRSHFVPVPFDFNINLYGMFAYQEDAVQVVEQILPFFRPEWTHSMKLVSSIDEYYDIPTVLSGLSVEDTYDTDFTQRRAITYTFNFTIKGYLIGPVKDSGVIKKSIIKLAADSDLSTEHNKKITLTPGLLSNGQPTSNATASVDYTQVNARDNYGFAFESEDFFSPEDPGSDPAQAPEEIVTPVILDLSTNSTITVTVSENNLGTPVFYLNGTEKPQILMVPNNVYTFTQSDPSNNSNPLSLITSEGDTFSSNVVITGSVGIDRQLILTTDNTTPTTLLYTSTTGGLKMGNTISIASSEF